MATRKSNAAQKIAAPEQPAISLRRPVVCFSLTMGQIGSKRSVSRSKVAIKKDAPDATAIVEDTDVDKSMVHVAKEILDSPELAKIVALGGEIRREIYKLSVPAQILKGGVYLIPVESVPDLEKLLDGYRVKHGKLLDEFVAGYPKQIAAAKKRLGSLFSDRDYPDVKRIRSAFSFSTSYLTIDVPQELGTINRELYEREKAKAQRVWLKAAEDVRLGLTTAFAGYVKHLAERLGKEPDGKLRIFRDSAVSNLTEFLDMFDRRDVTSDDQLRALVAKARSIVKNNKLDVDVDTLRKDEGFRDVIQADFAKLANLTSGLVETRRRLISFEDE